VHDHCAGTPIDLGYVRLGAVKRPLPLHPAARPVLAPDAAAALRGCIPAAVASRLAEAQIGWLNELRRVTTLFVSLPEINYNSPHTLEETQTVMQELQRALYRYEGSINKLSVDDKGVTLIAALGLPPLAHEDDAARAISAAQTMQARLKQIGTHCGIGIVTGRVFCGVVGSARRREYTMNGEVMPLGARLMQAASEDILCDAATYQAARGRLMFAALPQIVVKGRTEPVAIYRPQGTVPPGSLHGPMLGREAEQALLVARLETLQTGQSGAVAIEGEAGIGKSRLVGALREQARVRGIRTLIGSGDAVEAATPYFAWREICRQMLNLEERSDAAARRQRVLEQLHSEPELLRWAPLLNGVLSLDLPENEITVQMTGSVRAENIQTLLLRLLQTFVPRAPTVLILEDAHWLDSASWKLAALVRQSVHPVLLAIVMRPAIEMSAGEDRLLRTPELQRLALNPLSPEETLTLVRQRLGTVEIPAPVMALILHRAQGNPFFSEELALALRDSGLIIVANEMCQVAPGVDLESVTLPETVQGVIIHRIDRLTPSHQMLLKAASIIGQAFPLEILRSICPLEAAKDLLMDHLNALEQLGIVRRDRAAAQETYIFRHVITQEVVYNRMLFAQRRQLHRAVAEWYEQTCADHTPFYSALAYHWERAQEADKTLDYLDRAGEQALQSGAYEEAIRFLSHALALHAGATPEARRHGGRTEETLRRGRWERQLGEADLGLGHAAQSRQHLEEAMALLGYPLPTTPAKQVAKLLSQGLMQGLRRVRRGHPPLLSTDRQRIAREMSRICERLGELYYIANERLPLISAILHSINFAEAAGPSPELARAYANMAIASGLVPLRALAEAYCRLALDTATEIDQLSARAWVLEVTSVYRLGIGKWAPAREALGQAVQIYDRLDDRAHWRESVALLGEVSFHQGDFSDFTRRYTEIYANAQQCDNAQARIWAINGLADGALMRGEIDEAIRRLEEAVHLGNTTLVGSTDPPNDILVHGLMARARWWNGESDLARQAAERAAALIVRLPPVYVAAYQGYAGTAEVYLALWEENSRGGGEDLSLRQEALRVCAALRRFAHMFPIAWPRALLSQGLADSLSGRPAYARRAWRHSLSAAARLEMPFDAAMAHYEIGRHLNPDDPARHRHLSQAIELFTRMKTGRYLARAQAALGAPAPLAGVR
jgi:tetratricopeptide (TPR) repeat protein